MNRQRKVLITTTYNEMGIIIDTKAEEVAQPNLQPTCNQLATDCISRSTALDVIRNIRAIAGSYDSEMLLIDKAEAQTELMMMPSAQPERKTGRWILLENQRKEDVDNGNYLYICSECGKSDLHAKTQEVPFCWWCGAKMEVEHEYISG